MGAQQRCQAGSKWGAQAKQRTRQYTSRRSGLQFPGDWENPTEHCQAVLGTGKRQRQVQRLKAKRLLS